MARTIDNLGVDISTQYAESKQEFDESLITDSRSISYQTRIDVTAPSYPSEFDLLFELGKRGSTWPLHTAPTNYYVNRRRIFANQLIPALGTPEKQENRIERLQAYGEEEAKRQTRPHETNAVTIEKQTIVNLLGKVLSYDQQLIDINSRRAQYQKG